MLNVIWAAMVLIGVVFGAFHGTLATVGTAAIDGAKEAVTLSITMLGVMSLWCGIMEIAKESGLLASMTKGIYPVIRWLFPRIPKEDSANEEIATNIIANIFGLGSAATPAGLKAMESLARLNRYSQRASVEMCTFLIVNVSSLQLLPVNLIAYRSQYGSVHPTAIVGPAILATVFSTLAGVAFAKVMGIRAVRKEAKNRKQNSYQKRAWDEK